VALKVSLNANVCFFKLTLPLSNPHKLFKESPSTELTLQLKLVEDLRDFTAFSAAKQTWHFEVPTFEVQIIKNDELESSLSIQNPFLIVRQRGALKYLPSKYETTNYKRENPSTVA
jgi:hypothetical protein